ncbi:MAG: hypothetical protein ABI775_02840 [Pseudonocardiales bacterium]
MASNATQVTEFLPVLSRGKHRNPRRGACFMEFASFLAGERWSDHPACTHPLLAALARAVNDHSSYEGRQRLAGLIPDVIGLTGSDLSIDVRIALRAATTALPVVAEQQQRVMAAAVLTCERLLADLEGRPAAPMSARSRAALEQTPSAEAWAQRYTRGIGTSLRIFRRETAPTIITCAVTSIERACIPHPDVLLRDLLIGAVLDCRRYGDRREDAGRPDPMQNTEAELPVHASREGLAR